MLQTLAQAKADALKDIAGACPNGAKFLSYVNQATRRLLNYGDWTGTVVPIKVCAYCGCVVFPQYVQSVREMKICDRHVPIENNWYEFMDFPSTQWSCQCATSCCNHPPPVMVGATQKPVFQDIMGDGRYVRIYPVCSVDVGKTFTIYGIDNYGQPLKQLDGLGNWIEGHTIIIDSPYGSSSVFISRIDRIVREATQCQVRAFAYYAADDVLEPIGVYNPLDTNPSFSGYNMKIGTGSTSVTIMALVKLRFVPVVNDTDLVLIQNLDALKDMIQSVKFRESGDGANADVYEASAIRQLNLELRNNNPDEQIPINVRAFGTAYPSRHSIGRII